MIFYDTENFANGIFERWTRTGPKYGVPPADGVPYAYPIIPMEKVLKLDVEDEKFVDFIQNHIALEKIDRNWMGSWGWYILKEIDTEKWMNLYQEKFAQQRNLLQASIKKDKRSEQLKMF